MTPSTTDETSTIEDILQRQQSINPLPPRPTLPPRKTLHRQIKQTLEQWYLGDSRKNFHATVYYWSTYRYLTKSNFRTPQTDEILRPEALITYFHKHRLGWRPTIYHQAKVGADFPSKIILESGQALKKSDILYFVQIEPFSLIGL